MKTKKTKAIHMHIELFISKPTITSEKEKEVENTNATRGNVYTIHKYIEHPLNKPTTISMRDRQV